MLRHVLVSACTLGCVATAALWVRSYWSGDALQWEGRSGRVGVNVSAGRAAAFWDDSPTDPPRWDTVHWFTPPDLRGFVNSCSGPRWVACGFGYGDDDGYRILLFPLWLPTALWTGLLVLAVRCGRRPRPGAHHCGSCGYDLRHSPDRCPECGRRSTQA